MQERGMPMRGELAMPATQQQPQARDSGAWVVIGFCFIGLLLSLYFASQSLDDLPLLVVQYNLG
jgi:hypothetical protein